MQAWQIAPFPDLYPTLRELIILAASAPAQQEFILPGAQQPRAVRRVGGRKATTAGIRTLRMLQEEGRCASHCQDAAEVRVGLLSQPLKKERNHLQPPGVFGPSAAVSFT
jgi:hypothetical protein